jgi:hypothetical protein
MEKATDGWLFLPLVLCLGFAPGSPTADFINLVVGAAYAHAQLNTNRQKRFVVYLDFVVFIL